MPIQLKPSVVIAVLVEPSTNEASLQSGLQQITRICVLFCDHERITEGVYNNTDESELLLNFWLAIRGSDRIFSADVVEVVAMIRMRGWNLGIPPSAEVDLARALPA